VLRRSKEANTEPETVMVRRFGLSAQNPAEEAMACGYRIARSPRLRTNIPRDLRVNRYRDQQVCPLRGRQTYRALGGCLVAAQLDPVLVCSLDALLSERGITGRQLALEAGVTEATVSKLRRNTFVSIDAATFARICRYLQVQPGDLLSLK